MSPRAIAERERGYYWIKRDYCCIGWEIAYCSEDGTWYLIGSGKILYDRGDDRIYGPDFVTEVGDRIPCPQ